MRLRAIPSKAFEILAATCCARLPARPAAKGYQFNANRSIAAILIQMGDIAQAEAYLRRSLTAIQEARTSGLAGMARILRQVRPELGGARSRFRAAMIFEARGQFAEAEAAYRIAEAAQACRHQGCSGLGQSTGRDPFCLQAIDATILNQARMKARQGRLAEAEVDARRALLSRLKDTGKYNPVTPRFVMGLAGILVEQGRYDEAEQLARVALEINKTVGVPGRFAVDRAAALAARRHPEPAAQECRSNDMSARIDKAIANWDPQRRQVFELNPSRILSLYNSGQLDAGIAAAEQLVKKQIARVGENHFDTASARGTLAIGLMRARPRCRGDPRIQGRHSRHDGERARERRRREHDRRRRAQPAAAEHRRELLPACSRGPKARPARIGEETFGLADAIRGRSVQQALAASSARAAAKDPALAELVRKEQDLTKQVNAQLGTLNNVLAVPSAERDEKGVQEINASITALRAERDKARLEIKQKFPAYADLVSPKPPASPRSGRRWPTVRPCCRSISVRTAASSGRCRSRVQWRSRRSRRSSGDIESKIRKLREALEPQAAMISDIPPFDLKLAYELYELLLKPVESGWKPAKNLIVVTNGALGLLPLSLLPTAPAEVAQDDDPLFVGYRNVPWLARTHAVTTVPSAAALAHAAATAARQARPRRTGGVRRSLFQQGSASRGRRRRRTRCRSRTSVATSRAACR